MKFHEVFEMAWNRLSRLFSLTKGQPSVLVSLGCVALLSYCIVSLWTLSPAFEAVTVSRHSLSRWIFALSTFLLLVDLSAWSVLIMHWSKPCSRAPLSRKWRMSAFKHIAIAVFTQLILWFRVLLGIVLEVPLPSVELWFVATALAWMVTPFATLGWMHIGTRLVSWFERMG